MDAAHEGTLHDGLSSGLSRTLSHLDEVGAVVRLRARLTNPADEDVDSAERGPDTRTQLSRRRGPSLRRRCRSCRDDSWSSGLPRIP